MSKLLLLAPVQSDLCVRKNNTRLRRLPLCLELLVWCVCVCVYIIGHYQLVLTHNSMVCDVSVHIS